VDDRGAEAYAQAYEYITRGNPERSARWRRRMASRYLAVTAWPPLTRREKRAARTARRAARQPETRGERKR
jgi:predicted TIM-barrel fold metal-dependent hydrolase